MSLMKLMAQTTIVCVIPKAVNAIETFFTPDPKTEAPSPNFDTIEHELIAIKSKLAVAEEAIEDFISIVDVPSPLISSYEKKLDGKTTKLVADPNIGSWSRKQPENALAPTIVPEKKDIGPDPNAFIDSPSTPPVKKPRKFRDTTVMYLPHHTYICGLHTAWIKHWIGRSRTETPTINVLTALLNKHMGLDKVSSVYSCIWANPDDISKFGETEITYPFETYPFVIDESELATL